MCNNVNYILMKNVITVAHPALCQNNLVLSHCVKIFKGKQIERGKEKKRHNNADDWVTCNAVVIVYFAHCPS